MRTRYDFFKATLLQNRLHVVDYQFQDNFCLHVVASLAAGTCGTSALYYSLVCPIILTVFEPQLCVRLQMSSGRES